MFKIRNSWEEFAEELNQLNSLKETMEYIEKLQSEYYEMSNYLKDVEESMHRRQKERNDIADELTKTRNENVILAHRIFELETIIKYGIDKGEQNAWNRYKQKNFNNKRWKNINNKWNGSLATEKHKCSNNIQIDTGGKIVKEEIIGTIGFIALVILASLIITGTI